MSIVDPNTDVFIEGGVDTYISRLYQRTPGYAALAQSQYQTSDFNGVNRYLQGVDQATSYGQGAIAQASRSSAYGALCQAVDVASIAIGYATKSQGKSSIAIGDQAWSKGYRGVTIGTRARSSGVNDVSIGVLAYTSGPNGISLGTSARSSGDSAIAIGNTSNASNYATVMLGCGGVASGNQSTALGFGAQALHDYSIALGANSLTTATNQFVVTGIANPISDIYFGSGPASVGNPSSYTIHGAENQGGSDRPGGNVTIAGGRSTGTGAGGAFIIRTSPASGISGTAFNSLVDRVKVDQLGNTVFGTAALLTTATDGFMYVETCAGAPTGVPTAFTGRAPVVIDTTNGKLWSYYGAAWHFVALT